MIVPETRKVTSWKNTKGLTISTTRSTMERSNQKDSDQNPVEDK
jgi:hypothetical protein